MRYSVNLAHVATAALAVYALLSGSFTALAVAVFLTTCGVELEWRRRR